MAKKDTVKEQVEDNIVVEEPIIETPAPVYYQAPIPEGFIEVRQGDTIQSIAFTHGIGAQKIVMLNNFAGVNIKLTPGQQIRIR